MSRKKNTAVLTSFVLSVSLLAATLTAMLISHVYNRTYLHALGSICQEIIKNQPGAEQAIASALKTYTNTRTFSANESIILAYGYQPADILPLSGGHRLLFILIGFLTGGLFFCITLYLLHRKESTRLKTLTDYLEKVNRGDCGLLFPAGEDDFSKLQDEIYKTVTTLYQTRDAALKARNNYAENLSNIAHQLKTPITSISLSVQMLKESPSLNRLEQIRQQLSRLTCLEESLLLLSRIDAGTLPLEKRKVDVFTLLMLAADNLQELFSKANVTVEIPESGQTIILADLDWTMEGIMNLLKNCMEHTPPGGTVSCRYEQNALFTQILIWDTGMGFAKEDIPHLFERFYRGQNPGSSGIGLGLSLSKAIIELQNGTISARNLADGGACFEIRFYSH